ncbi:21 kDa protein [Apostasia shenzhenica]|uniref:21 kDa protein n=1 Tax=Apostasia shenzhenica TaxID=1088818 RepID=A0A2H9ZUT6_9ASPA|nr:21 kDa protein [Apostasia shenzhenica]
MKGHFFRIEVINKLVRRSLRPLSPLNLPPGLLIMLQLPPATMPALLLSLFLLVGAGTGQARSAGGKSSAPPSSLVTASCAHASYPDLCVRTLATSAATTPAALAVDCVCAAGSAARNAASFLRRLTPPPPPAVRDCAEQISDSADQLARAAGELRRLRRVSFRWQLDNAQTWVSAALTDEDTCLDAIRRLPVATRRPVSARVSEARRVTCNSLDLVARLAAGGPRRRL